MKNPYDILGIKADASDEEVKRAYRKLAMQWHPDRNEAPEAEERFRDIRWAYDTLTDPDKRAAWRANPENRYVSVEEQADVLLQTLIISCVAKEPAELGDCDPVEWLKQVVEGGIAEGVKDWQEMTRRIKRIDSFICHLTHVGPGENVFGPTLQRYARECEAKRATQERYIKIAKSARQKLNDYEWTQRLLARAYGRG